MILEFHNVSVPCPANADTGLDGVSFALEPGALLLVRVDAADRRSALPDVAQGLLAPVEGLVRFEGEDWQQMSAERAAAQRGKIGRVFEEGGWLSNLDVDENITLSERYHTSRPAADVLAEARALAVALGMPSLPAGRPSGVPRLELRRAQWVRALLGGPRLLVLDHAAEETPAPWREALLRQVTVVRAAGTAVVWITSEPTQWQDSRLNATLKFELNNGMMSRA